LWSEPKFTFALAINDDRITLMVSRAESGGDAQLAALGLARG
jgi:hypothetical protein